MECDTVFCRATYRSASHSPIRKAYCSYVRMCATDPCYGHYSFLNPVGELAIECFERREVQFSGEELLARRSEKPFEFLRKPFTAETLLTTLRDLLAGLLEG